MEKPEVPATDPTTNVLKLVQEAIRRQDDLRLMEATYTRKLAKQESRWRDKLGAVESKWRDAEAMRESGRVNALLEASTSNVALALEKQSGQAQAQDRRIAALEQNQYQVGGRDIQRESGSRSTQWAVGLAVFIGGAILTAVIAVVALLLRQ